MSKQLHANRVVSVSSRKLRSKVGGLKINQYFSPAGKIGMLFIISLFFLTGLNLNAQTTVYDFGDAPNPYPTILNQNGAYHKIVAGFYLGNSVDNESDGQPTYNAKGDDNTSSDDEDGVNFTTSLVKGNSVTVVVTASASGMLNAWLDFNDDGDWADAGEQIFTNKSLSSGNNTLYFNVPSNAKAGYTFTRFRLNMNGGISYTGYGYEGEVEDYRVKINDPAPTVTYDFGDAPSPYPTLLNEDGARHTIDPQMYLGQGVDSESDGQPDSTATGDDNDGNDDEDGVEWLQELVPNDTTLVRVTASKGGFLKAWIDFNQDGDWEDEGEKVCDSQVGEGTNELQVVVPDSAEEGYTFARFRFSGDTIPSPEGTVTGGEVEDMRVYVENFRFYDYGDAPDNDSLHYETLFANNGARHPVSDTLYLGWRLTGADMPDIEFDGQQNYNARGDDYNDDSDETAIHFRSVFAPGATTIITAEMFGAGYLHGWIDFNCDGDFKDTDEYFLAFDNTVLDEYRKDFECITPETAVPGTTFARFRYSMDPVPFTPGGRGRIGEVEDYQIEILPYFYDYGDAPESYSTPGNEARHPVNRHLNLGGQVDADSCFQSSENADGDDTDSDGDDENGVVFSDMNPGETTEIIVDPQGMGSLAAWIDWNQDGDWDELNEYIIETVPISPGVSPEPTFTFNIDVPEDAVSGYTYARFRYSMGIYNGSSIGSIAYFGEGFPGEVEDYRIRIGEMMFDYGDAPYPFKTRLQQNGARHIVDPNIYLGYGVDADADGVPDSLATGDSNDNFDDDDGVTFQGAWILGNTVKAVVKASTNGYLSIWGANAESQYLYKQLGKTGDFPYENTKIELQQGDNSVEIDVDEGDFDAGIAYFRFRYSTLPIDSADGIALDGEVEDYRVEIFDDLDFPAEYGDAPEGIMAYPDRGVMGSFPTLKDSGPAGYVSHGTRGQMYLGYSVDYELDGDEGTAAPVGDPWDMDEGLNDRRGDVTIYKDLGLTDPCNYTIRGETGSEFYWPYSVLGSRGVLGNAGETVRWGDYDLDGVYHVTAEDGAYLNILIDWNQDGSWGGDYDWFDGLSSHTTPEHIIQNFHIPKKGEFTGYGILSDLDPPEFVLPDDVNGYVWMRWTISDSTVAPGWDGSGLFGDGETEDYLVAVNFDSLFDYGDAPQGALAYPSTGVIGEFQTAWGIPGTIGCAIWHHKSYSSKFFGNCIDFEWTGNAGLAYLTPWVYDADENYNNEAILEVLQDAGLRMVMPYKIQGMPGLETVEPYVPLGTTSLRRSLGGVGETAVWGTNLDMEVTLRTGTYSESYFTFVIDWDQDGLWEMSEIVHHNILLSHTGSSFDGMLSELGLPNFEIGPTTGYVWARFILSERPVTAWFGEYFAGETEDYLLHVSERSFRYDWGDAPYPFPTNSQENGARHLFDGNVYLGSSVDTEEEGQGDEKASSDYDDGVTFQGAWIPGDTVTAYITVSDSGYLSIWGSFGPNNTCVGIADNAELMPIPKLGGGSGGDSDVVDPNPYKIPIPVDAALGTAYLRFRFSTQPVDSIGGIAPDGEVEDYRIEVFDRLVIPYEYGDAPENAIAYPHLVVTGQFPTFKDEGPAGYVRHGTTGDMYLGILIDYEIDGNAGVTPPFGGDYDQDEKHNEIRNFMDVSNDIGLVAPHAYSITERADTLVYWPYSVYHMTRGSLGDEPGDIAEWGTEGGRHLDIKYHVKTSEGAYVNMLIDWNQDGQWGGTDEHVLVNFYVPEGFGRLSDHGPPPITVGETQGHAWVRVTISETTVEEDWDGSGNFADGETEDYLICASYDELYDYGDAPEGALAYPSSGVIGNFPTSVGITNAGFIRHQHGGNRSFRSVDYEYEGNAGLSPLFTNYYDADESFYNTIVLSHHRDAGLYGLFPHTIKGGAGSEYVDVYDDGTGLPQSLGSVGQMAAWGTNLDLSCHINLFTTGGAYVNVLIDWNQDGDWGDIVDYPSRGITVPERVLRNFYIPNDGWGGYLSTFSPPDFRIGPNSGYAWMRCTITRMPVETWGWDGSGDYVDGETEDYLIKIEDYSHSFDFGDVPILSYGVLHSDNGAIHTVQAGFCLGDLVDPDPDGWPIPGGTGDDTDGSDDDDGIEFLTPLVPGQTAQIKATVSGSGILSGWIDFNADSSWDDPGEQIWNDSQVTSGYEVLSFTVPNDAVLGVTYARFRFSDTSGLSFNGPPHFSDFPDQSSMPPKGEVEDYAVLICAAGATYDFGDAPDPTYPTLSASSGAYHVIDPNVYLGTKIDSEVDGLPHAQALGDDHDVSDDEDGVQFPATIVSGTTVSASVTLSVQGYLNVWMDLNADGDWFDMYEHVVNDSVLIGGTHNVNFPVSLYAIPDSLMFARIRFSTFPGTGVMGPAADGEVEDYLLNVVLTGVDEQNDTDEIPTKFALLQNFPNPFNPVTTIKFQLPVESEVRLIVYDIKGRKVCCLVQKIMSAGVHTVKWRGKDQKGHSIASGIYFYQMVMDPRIGSLEKIVQVGKMLFLK